MLVPIETVGADVRASLVAGDRALGKAEQHYVSAGLKLIDAKKRLAETREMLWSAFLFSHARVGDRRARELMAIADGRTTLAEVREKKAQSVRETRERQKAKSALRSAAAEIAAMPDNQEKEENQEDLRAVIEHQAKEIEALKRKLAKAEETIADKEAARHFNDARAREAEKQSEEVSHRLLFANAEKERLAEQLAAALEENARLLADLDALTAPATASDDDRQFNALKSAWEKATPEVQQRWIAREGMTPATPDPDDFDPSNLWLAKERAAA